MNPDQIEAQLERLDRRVRELERRTPHAMRWRLDVAEVGQTLAQGQSLDGLLAALEERWAGLYYFLRDSHERRVEVRLELRPPKGLG